MTQKITPCLWHDGTALEAAEFYITLLPDSRIESVMRAPSDNPSMSEGAVMAVQFTLGGMKFLGLNGGPQFPFTEAVSFQIHTDSQEETDRLWAAVTGNGGAEGQCGWCKDRWGMSWQIVPRRLMALIGAADPDAARRVSMAMLKMRKIDIATLEAAAEAQGAAS